ncbi:MAG: hypothetical protein IIX61_08090, partial [Loktanella sp.]|nr:hypothetical protein [Loktanella sp.]
MVKLASAVGWKTAREIEVLIARVALDDKKAFSVLYNTTHKKIFSVVLGILGNRADADDAAQETYLKIWRYANRYTTNGMSPMTWLI